MQCWGQMRCKTVGRIRIEWILAFVCIKEWTVRLPRKLCHEAALIRSDVNPLKAVVRIYPYLPLCRVWWLWSPLNKLWSSYGHENLATWHSNVEDYSSTNKFGNVFKRFPKLMLEKQIRNGFLNKPCLQRVKSKPAGEGLSVFSCA